MPELPEVETIARRLREAIVGKTIQSFEVRRSKSFVGDPSLAAGKEIRAIGRRSKILWFELSEDLFLLVHLKMTGQLLFDDGGKRIGGGHPTKDFDNPLPAKATRVVISFTDGTTLYFNDLRVFGWIKVADVQGLQTELAGFGPDASDQTIDADYFFDQLQRRSVAIKLAVMDNAIVAGVGNIYANDALHLAKIDPRRAARSLSREEAARLLQAMQTVITAGIAAGGATIQHYRTIDGLTGSYQHQRRVYARENELCLVCGTTIVRIKQAGRSTFYCPTCQI